MTVIELDIEIPDLARAEVEEPLPMGSPPSGETVLLVAVPGEPGPRGFPGTGAPIVGESLTGTKDGVNTVFTTAAPFNAGTTAVYLNGLREYHYTESGANQITMEDAPLAGDSLRIDYIVV